MMTYTDRHIRVTAMAGLVAATLAAYYNTFDGAWIFDDYSYVIDNPFVRELWVFGTGYPHPYRPVLEWTYSFNYALGDLNIAGYHVFNLCVHILATLILFIIVRRTLVDLPGKEYIRSATPLAFTIALLWMLHPLQTESVTYISQRSESLMGLLILISLFGVVRGACTEQQLYRHIWYGISVVSFMLGCGVKEVMAVGLPVLAVYDRIFLTDSWEEVHRRRWGVYMGYLTGIAWLVSSSNRFGTSPEVVAGLLGVLILGNLLFDRMYETRMQQSGRWIRRGLVVGVCLITTIAMFLALSQLVTSMETYTAVTPVNYALSQVSVIAHYLRLVVWPAPLILDHDWPVVGTWTDLGMPALITLLAAGATVWSLWKHPRIGFLCLSFFLILSPTSSLVPLRDLAVEHRMYLPLAPLISLAVLAAHTLISRLQKNRLLIQGALVGAVAVALGLCTIDRNEDYATPITLLKQSLEYYPDHKRVHLNLAQRYTQRKEYESAHRHYQQGLPFNWLKDELGSKVHYNFGVTLHALKQMVAAETQYRLAIGLEPKGKVAASSYNQLGLLAAEKNNLNMARTYFEAARRVVPTYAIAYKNLGLVFAMRGRWGSAQKQLTEAIRLDPEFAEAHFTLGEVLENTGRVARAIRSYREAVRIDPNHVEARKRLSKHDRQDETP